MAFSGTVSQTKFTTRRVIDSAMRRCKVPAQTITAEHIDIAKDQLYLMLSDWANDKVPLWCIETQLYSLTAGQAYVTLDIGTVDVLSANLRTVQAPPPLAVVINPDSFEIAYDGIRLVTGIVVQWAADAVPFVVETSLDGLTWFTVQEADLTAAAGQTTWLDLDTAVSTQFIRVRATGGTLAATFGAFNTPTEIPLYRMNIDEYSTLPNKFFPSERPLQYWLDRQVRQPVMRLWPMPNLAAQSSCLVIQRQRHIMDVGSMTQEIEVPQRWYEALVANLAVKLAYEIAEVDTSVIGVLTPAAGAALQRALAEERDNSPTNWVPGIGVYTR